MMGPLLLLLPWWLSGLFASVAANDSMILFRQEWKRTLLPLALGPWQGINDGYPKLCHGRCKRQQQAPVVANDDGLGEGFAMPHTAEGQTFM